MSIDPTHQASTTEREAEQLRAILERAWARTAAEQTPEPHDVWIAATLPLIQHHANNVGFRMGERRAASLQTRVNQLTRTIQAQLRDGVAEDNIDLELAQGILDACSLPRLRHHYTVRVQVVFEVDVTAEGNDDAEDAATTRVTDLLQDQIEDDDLRPERDTEILNCDIGDLVELDDYR
ncbi:hypothetical protein GCM10010123_19620 [Pilimelia anulata]|uniref:Uncharacterized protein n=1 Tax=Pilimelia anulata TaxID=53371 RepID=A0A8J3B9K2_9ACTN|nr:hypothetical protein [Pilimelia anulata]GGJ89878.1 hypothetical protein GCM10010123_19620 [Pilimelia anulata]